MKKGIIYILLAFTCLMQACSDDETTVITGASMLNVSPSRVTLGQTGGKETIFVSTSYAWELDIAQDNEWLTVSDRSAGSFVIGAEANTTTEPYAATITVTVTEGGRQYSKSIYVIQQSAASSDLSADGAANSYIAVPGGEYRFIADRKGNGIPNRDGMSGFTDRYGTDITDAVYADLIWEAAFDGDKTRSNYIIEGDPYYRDGYIYFQTGTREGNAVIAVKDYSGTILWSWHIWVLAGEITTSEYDGYEWMDLNLGASVNAPGNIDNRGLLYQWGRKDPFLPSMAPYDSVGPLNAPEANIDNPQNGQGVSAWDYHNTLAPRAEDAPGNIRYTILHPTVLLRRNNASSDWYIIPSQNYEEYSYLWGNSERADGKSVFDPCPPGYTVPPAVAWATSDGDSWSETTENGRYWDNGNGAYYPMAGYRDPVNGNLAYCGATGYYWSREAVNTTDESGACALNISYEEVSFPILSRSIAASVRCIKER